MDIKVFESWVMSGMWLVISIRLSPEMATSSNSRPLSNVLGVDNGGVGLVGVGREVVV